MERYDMETCTEQPNGENLVSPDKRRRNRCIRWLPLLLLGACTALALAEEPAGKDLKLFYQQNCAVCHGIDGSAISPEGKKLKGQDLTDERWLKNTSDKKMLNVILNGKFFGMAMPRFHSVLSTDEAQRMVTEIIRTSSKGKPIAPEIPLPAAE